MNRRQECNSGVSPAVLALVVATCTLFLGAVAGNADGMEQILPASSVAASAYDAPSDAWWTVDPQGTVTRVSPKGREVLPHLPSTGVARELAVVDGHVFVLANDAVFRYDAADGWTPLDAATGARAIIARGSAILVPTDHGVIRSFDGGVTFAPMSELDARDTPTAMDATDDAVVVGTAYGDVVEISSGTVRRAHLCKGPVAGVTAALASRALYVACDGVVLGRDDDIGTWRVQANSIGAVRAMAADPFHGDALYVSTAAATYRVHPVDGAVRVSGPSEELRVVHSPTHSFVAARENGRLKELQPVATASGCDVIVYNFSKNLTTRAEPNPSYPVLHYTSVYRIRVATSTPTCRWTFDKQTKPSWVHAGFVTGKTVPKTSIDVIGSATVDITVDSNAGLLRSGSYVIRAPKYNIRSTVSQTGRKGRCFHKPVVRDGTPATAFSDGELLVMTLHWGEPLVKSPRIITILDDRSGCHAEPWLWGTSERFRGSMISSAVENRVPKHVLSSPYVPSSVLGEGALYGLRGNGIDAAPSAMALIVVPQLKDLPADLQITGTTLRKTFYSVGKSGGAIVLSGQVTRATANPNRRCAWDSALFTVIGGNSWMTVSPTESGCDPTSPDRGKIVINVEGKGFSSTHYGVVFSPWGWYSLIVQ